MYNGTVQRIFSKPFGGKLLHSFTLQGEKGFFGLGRVAPTFKEGDQLSFEAVPSKREGNYDVKAETIKLSTETLVRVEDYSMSGAKKQVVLQKDDYWKNREDRDLVTQKRIEIQAARNAAIALLQVTGTTEQLPTADEYVTYWTNMFLVDNEERLAG